MQSLKELYKVGKGPSSSHTMGPERAAREFLSLCPNAAKFRVELYGSLARTGKGHLTDEAVAGIFAPRETEVVFDTEKNNLPHPNTFTMYSFDEAGNLLAEKTYLSVGGGTVRALGEKEKKERDVYPFANFTEIREFCTVNRCGLDDVVFRFEGEEIREYLRFIWRTMKATVECGLTKTGELPGSLHVQRKAYTLSKPVAGEGTTEREKRMLGSYAFATAEENAGGGRVVTAPTCGASGVLPAVLMYLYKKRRLPEDKMIRALAVAGLIGNVVKQNASISGAEAGCQAEIGTATAMAAAAVCCIYDYTLEETEYAAEIALEHQLGLTCDPIHGYVQIPCIERNAVAALRALDGAELAHVLSGTRKISFDQIVKTMYETGKDICERYRETSEGGLAALFKH